MRYAIYWCPDDDDPLLAAGESWLGRRVTGAIAEQPRLHGLSSARFAQLTLAPSRYGFHATFVAPMTLIEGATEARFIEAASSLARDLGPVPIPSLAVAKLSGFAALRPVESERSLAAIAARAVSALDPLRRPPKAEEMIRRQPHRLNAHERELLERWGYPYVFDAYRFHLTLSEPVAGAESDALVTAARRHFAAALARPRALTSLAIFVEPSRNAPFRLAARLPLRGAGQPAVTFP